MDSISTFGTTTASMEIVNNGRLVYACKQPTPRHLDRYEAHRCKWLTTYRNRYAPQSYREGRYNLISFAYSIITIFWR